MTDDERQFRRVRRDARRIASLGRAFVRTADQLAYLQHDARVLTALHRHLAKLEGVVLNIDAELERRFAAPEESAE